MNDHSTALDHAKKLQRAIDFIRAHIREPLTASQVAQAAHTSPFHFQRLFKAHMNETLGQYITRKKLECAAVALLYGQHSKVSELAHTYGYASTASFSKAFASWFGCRPTSLAQLHTEEANGRLQAYYQKTLLPDELSTSNAPYPLFSLDFASIDERVSIRQVEAFEVYTLTSQGGYELDAIDELWSSFQERLEDLGHSWETLDRYAICHDHPGLLPKAACRYDACVKIDGTLPDDLPFVKAMIPAGRYAIYPCFGPNELVLPQYIAFYSIWMAQSPYMPDDFPVLDHCINPHLQASPRGEIIECWAKIKRCA